MNQAGTQLDPEIGMQHNGAPSHVHNGMDNSGMDNNGMDNGMNNGAGEMHQHGMPLEHTGMPEKQDGDTALPSADNMLGGPGNSVLEPSVLLALAEQTLSKTSGGAHNPGKRKREEEFQPGPSAPPASVPQMPAQGLQATAAVPLHDLALGVVQELGMMPPPQQAVSLDPLNQANMMDQFNQRAKMQPVSAAGMGMPQNTQNNQGSFEDGYSQGFLAGLYYIQQNMQSQQGGQKDGAANVPHMAKSWQVNTGPHTGNCVRVSDEQTAVFNITKFSPRRPYRFCSKCWIKNKKWVLRSIKLPSGRSINLHGDMCPEWPVGEEQPTAIQMRAYGAAFKQAQRSSQLHSVALEAFKQAAPEMTDHELQDHLCGS